MKKRTRRSPQQQIADLQAKIATIQQRAERKKAMQDPALKHVTSALRSIERALAECKDPAMRKSLGEARELLGSSAPSRVAVLVPAGGGGRRSKKAAAPRTDPAAVLRFLQDHPGSRCEDIAQALETDSRALSTLLKGLKTDGKAKTEGQARGTRYFAVK